MIPGEFEYHRATSTDDAIRMLAGNDGAKLVAGGHSLLPMMKLRLAAPALLVDIGGIEDLNFIRQDGADLLIGSMTTHAAVAGNPIVAAGHQALAEAAASIGDVQVRNRGTLGGSLAHADPAADYPAVALALDASIEVAGPNGTRSMAAADLFAGLLTTSLEAAEIITAVRFPDTAGARSVYEKFAQPASGFAIVGVAATITEDDGTCTAAAVAATGVSDRPVRLSAVEQALVGSTLDAGGIAAAAEQANIGLDDVRSDLYAAEDYRRHLLQVVVRRAVARARS